MRRTARGKAVVGHCEEGKQMSDARFQEFVYLLLALGVAVALLLLLQLIHFLVVVTWCDRRTVGLNYYGMPPPRRRRFRLLLRVHFRLLCPILTLLSALVRCRLSHGTFLYRGVAGPRGSCSPDSFRRAAAYRPRPEDVFVVAQMKCGTTWMQHLVFQVLTRGNGDLVADGIPLNAVSPWLESFRTVDIDHAPLIGHLPRARVIKTHLPASLCPFSTRAKYIYVVRHPVSCFASCADFIRNNLRGFSLALDELEEWYRSNELMWWNTWAAHVSGWWHRAESESNTLLIRFEDMKRDLATAARQVARLLDVPALTDRELSDVVHKCSFEYMRQNEDLFEMHPPHLLQTPGRFFVSGKVGRCDDVPVRARQRIADWSCAELAARAVPAERLYPELAGHRSDETEDEDMPGMATGVTGARC